MTNELLFGVVAVPAIIGLVEVLKDAGVPGRFAPIAAVAFGILAGLAQLEAGRFSWIPAVVIGTALGLSAVGLYSATGSAAANFIRPQAESPATTEPPRSTAAEPPL